MTMAADKYHFSHPLVIVILRQYITQAPPVQPIVPLPPICTRYSIHNNKSSSAAREKPCFTRNGLTVIITKADRELVLFSLALLLGFYGLYIAVDCMKALALYLFTPLKYFDVYAVSEQGFSVAYLLISAVMIAASIMIAGRTWRSRKI